MKQLMTLFVCLALPIVVTGCASPFNTEATTPAQTTTAISVMKDEAGRQVADEVAKYAVSVPPGSSDMVYLTGNRRITVYVGADYISATGESCRRVTLSTATSEPLTSAVCEISQTWKTVLWPLSN